MVHARVSLQSRQKYAAKRTICYFQVDQEQPILPPLSPDLSVVWLGIRPSVLDISSIE